MRVKYLLPAGVRKMTLSYNRIIKLRDPIRKITAVPLDNFDENPPGDFKENISSGKGKRKNQLIQIPKEEYDQNLEANFQKGFEEGHRAAVEQIEKEYEEKFSKFSEMIENFEKARQHYFRHSDKLLLDFSLNMTEKILKELPPYVPGMIEASVKRVLNVLSNEPVVEIHMNPGDMENIKDLENLIERRMPGIDKISFKENPKITRGGCVVETDNGKIDARIETQVTKLVQELRKELATTKTGAE